MTMHFGKARALEPAANPTRAVISQAVPPGIVAVDVATGNRNVLVQPTGGIGVTFTLPGPLALNPADSRLFVAQNGVPKHLFAVPLPDVSRELISGTDVARALVRGTGPLQQFVTALAVDSDARVVFMNQPDYAAVMAIDVASGDRVLISR